MDWQKATQAPLGEELQSTLQTLLNQIPVAVVAPDYPIRKDCPMCRHHIKKADVTHPGMVEILPQADGWWQLMHTRCLRQWVVASYGSETVIDISGPTAKGER